MWRAMLLATVERTLRVTTSNATKGNAFGLCNYSEITLKAPFWEPFGCEDESMQLQPLLRVSILAILKSGSHGQCHVFVFFLSDAKCGKIQCHSAAKKPKGTNAVSIDTTIRRNGLDVKCRGTYVYTTQEGQGDLPDPGLVITGTKCGEGKVSWHSSLYHYTFTTVTITNLC